MSHLHRCCFSAHHPDACLTSCLWIVLFISSTWSVSRRIRFMCGSSSFRFGKVCLCWANKTKHTRVSRWAWTISDRSFDSSVGSSSDPHSHASLLRSSSHWISPAAVQHGEVQVWLGKRHCDGDLVCVPVGKNDIPNKGSIWETLAYCVMLSC